MSTLTSQIAKHFRDVHFGGNWTVSNFKDVLADVSWQQATARVGGYNTILGLTYHAHYFVNALLRVLQGHPLDAHDKFSFDHPAIRSQHDWELFLQTVWNDAENTAALIEKLPDSILAGDFADKKYGSYYRNITGTIEHLHYHLGQIVILKKMLVTK